MMSEYLFQDFATLDTQTHNYTDRPVIISYPPGVCARVRGVCTCEGYMLYFSLLAQNECQQRIQVSTTAQNVANLQ